MKRIHIVGRKNSGKTTLMVELVTALTSRGYKVATIKHTHHNHELDTPGKDSHRHREAGSQAVGILSPQMNAIFWPCVQSGAAAASKYQLFESLMGQCDIVLVEGDSSAEGFKIEVYRGATETPPMAASVPDIQAVVTDDPVDVPAAIWPRAELDTILQNIERQIRGPALDS